MSAHRADRALELVLPWPDKALSPNARTHWAVKAGAAKRQRRDAYIAAKQAGWDCEDWVGRRIHLWIDFYPPTRRMPDDDNMLARMKPARDGIADAIGIDDRMFVSHPYVHDEARKGGEVRIRITGATQKMPGSAV